MGVVGPAAAMQLDRGNAVQATGALDAALSFEPIERANTAYQVIVQPAARRDRIADPESDLSYRLSEGGVGRYAGFQISQRPCEKKSPSRVLPARSKPV
mgnify:CR=1 FL=1